MASKAQQKAIVKAILERYPKSYAEALHINVGKNTPAPLYQWLLCSLLMSARINANQARQAAAALFDAGWTTPEKMAATTWEQRGKVLNENGYARYDESTARYIADTTEIINDRYSGDLRNLRKEADNDPEQERALLQQFKGIGKVGADIFFREVQVAWEEHFPFVDREAADAAADLGLDNEALTDLAGKRENLPRLLTGLVRAALDDAKDDILAAAA